MRPFPPPPPVEQLPWHQRLRAAASAAAASGCGRCRWRRHGAAANHFRRRQPVLLRDPVSPSPGSTGPSRGPSGSTGPSRGPSGAGPDWAAASSAGRSPGSRAALPLPPEPDRSPLAGSGISPARPARPRTGSPALRAEPLSGRFAAVLIELVRAARVKRAVAARPPARQAAELPAKGRPSRARETGPAAGISSSGPATARHRRAGGGGGVVWTLGRRLRNCRTGRPG